MRFLAAAVFAAVLAAGCGSDGVDPITVGQAAAGVASTEAGDSGEGDAGEGNAGSPLDEDRFPVVVAVATTSLDAGTWRFEVTMSSLYDSADRYADAWRVLDRDGNELGVRVLLHDHATEQPFTRSTTVEVPPDETLVFVEGRDQLNGWSGQRFAVNLDAP